MNKKISIIVPVYNVQNELDRCVNSLVNQTYNNIEIILVDDGSTDASPIMCDEWAKKDTRIQVIHKINGGLSDARNCGLNQAIGDYILYVDSDDFIDLDSCERFILSTMNQKIDIVVGNAIMEKEQSNELINHTSVLSNKIYNSKDFIIECIKSFQWYAPAWLNMYRREFLIEHNLFFKKGIYFEDVEMLPRVFLSAKDITCLEGIFYHYVIRDNSIMTSQKNEKKKKDAINNLRSWKHLFDEITDFELKKYLYGMLVKMYLYECRIFEIKTWEIEGINFKFAIKYAINSKEKLKVLLFQLFPQKYIRISNRR